jgi:hypothetical protein
VAPGDGGFAEDALSRMPAAFRRAEEDKPILVNSHDGASSCQMLAGRVLVVDDSLLEQFAQVACELTRLEMRVVRRTHTTLAQLPDHIGAARGARRLHARKRATAFAIGTDRRLGSATLQRQPL